jgi:hypothetical protein
MKNRFIETHSKDSLTKGFFTSEFILSLLFLIVIYTKADNWVVSLSGAIVVSVYIYARSCAKKSICSTNVSHFTVDKTG